MQKKKIAFFSQKKNEQKNEKRKKNNEKNKINLN